MLEIFYGFVSRLEITKLRIYLDEKDDTIKQKDDTIRQRDDVIRQRDDTIRQKDDTIRQKDKLLEEICNSKHLKKLTITLA